MKIFLACFLTVLIETPFLALHGYRKWSDIIIIVCTNVVTNLVLNLTIIVFFGGKPGWWVILLECVVVISEYIIYRSAFEGSKKLVVLTIAANCISYWFGRVVLLFST